MTSNISEQTTPPDRLREVLDMPNRKEKTQIVWTNATWYVIVHLLALYGAYLTVTEAKLGTIIFACFLSTISIGVINASHRFWSHRSFKTKLPAKILMMVLQTASFQDTIYVWARDHRQHHKYQDTHADPINSRRGFFFSHRGWITLERREEAPLAEQSMDGSDLLTDPVVMFQKKYYFILAPTLAFLVPALIPWYFWNEAIWNSFLICGNLRCLLSLHFAFLLNSRFDNKPYTKNLKVSDSDIVTYSSLIQTNTGPSVIEKSEGKLEKSTIVWNNVVLFSLLHLGASYGIWLAFTEADWKTTVYMYISGMILGYGITAGAHRLWAHKAYKARLPLRILLMILQSGTLQSHIFEWVRDHRVHHKFTDTDADPYNIRRGFFFAHMGWLLVKKHPDVLEKGKTVDVSDLEADPVVTFQRKYYVYFAPIFSLFLVPLVPWYCWNETWLNSFFIAGIFRYILSLHFTWLVNSAAHVFGTKPYDRGYEATENWLVSLAANGEGWHNYHHTFPWDYKAGELGNYGLNTTTALLDFMASIGWAYDLKTVAQKTIEKRIQKTGDGSWNNEINLKIGLS